MSQKKKKEEGISRRLLKNDEQERGAPSEKRSTGRKAHKDDTEWHQNIQFLTKRQLSCDPMKSYSNLEVVPKAIYSLFPSFFPSVRCAHCVLHCFFHDHDSLGRAIPHFCMEV